MADTKRFIVELDFNDGTGWVDISGYTILKEFSRQRNLYNQLSPTTDSCSFKIKYNVQLVNRLLNSDEDIQIRIKAVAYWDLDDNGTYETEVIQDYFTGFVQKNYKMSSSSRVDWVEINAVDNNYILDSVISKDYGVKGYFLYNSQAKDKSIVHIILGDAGIAEADIKDGVAVHEQVPIIIDFFKHFKSQPSSENDALSDIPYGGTFQEIITNLLFQYGYTYYFNKSGRFQLFNFAIRDVMETGTGPFFDEVNNSNMVGTLVATKKPPRYEATEITWNKILYKSDILLVADTDGGGVKANGDTYCDITVKPNKYYPLNSSATNVPEVFYDINFKTGETTDDLIQVDNATLYDGYSGTNVEKATKSVIDTPESISYDYTYEWVYDEDDDETDCKGLFGSLGKVIKRWITNTEYVETKCIGTCCRIKKWGVCFLGGFHWRTRYKFYVIDKTIPTTVPATYKDEPYDKVLTGAGYEAIDPTFSANALSFNLRIKNIDDYDVIIKKLEIRGDAVLRGDDEIYKNYDNGDSDKVFKYNATYIHEEEYAKKIGDVIFDYYYYSTFQYKMKCTEEFEPGTWVTLTDNNFNSIGGDPLVNKLCLVVSRKDVEFTQEHSYVLEEYRATGLQVVKEYISHKPIIKVGGGGNNLNVLPFYNLDPYVGSGVIKTTGGSINGRYSENWPYTGSGNISLGGGGTYVEDDNKYVFQPTGKIKSSGNAEIDVYVNNIYDTSGGVETYGYAAVEKDSHFIGSGNATTSGNARTSRYVELFQSVWDITGTGIGDRTIKLPLEDSSPRPAKLGGGYYIHNYDFTVDWGDGVINQVDSYDSSNATHTYSSTGTYTINIYGIIDGFGFSDSYSSDDYVAEKLVDITEFGSLFRFHNHGGVLSGTTNLTDISATYAPNIENIDSLDHMFHNSGFNGDVSGWDVSDIINMDYMFYGTPFNQDITGWDTSSVTSMKYMFYGSSFNSSLANFDVSAVTSMTGMFYKSDFNNDVSGWDTSNVTTTRQMFAYTPFNKSIAFDMSSVLYTSNMFYGTPFNQDISGWDVSNVSNMDYMFWLTPFNQDITGWDTSSLLSVKYMFYGSDFNQDISGWDTSKVKNMLSWFRNSEMNQDLTGLDISSLDLSQVNGMMMDTFSGSKMSTENMSRLLIYLETLEMTDVIIRATGIHYNSSAADAVLVLRNRRWNVVTAGEE